MDLTTWPTLVAFLLASLVLAATPGPAVLYIVARTMAQGRRAGLASMAGVALGNLGNAVGASLGLAALFAISSAAFTVVKFAGAAYLIYLGIKALRPVEVGGPAADFAALHLGRIFRDGFLVALLNPKVVIFFAAFLPQFIDPAGSAIAQSILFGVVFVLIAACSDAIYVWGADALGPSLKAFGRGRAAGRYATASVFIGLGIFAAASGSRAAK